MAKSIIEIDVKDGPFKAFTELFEKYQKQLGKMPNQWANVGKQTTGAAAGLGSVIKNGDKLKKQLSDIDKNAQNAGRSFKGMARTSGDIAKNIGKATLQLAKWAALGGLAGLATGAGGLFGMASLAGSASGVRRQSQGLGITPGELRSAEVNYSKFLDVVPTLGKITDAQADLSKRWAFSALGVNQNGKNAAELLPELLPKLVEKFKQVGGTSQGAEAFGLTQFADIQTLRRLSKLSPGELEQTGKEYAKDRQGLASDDRMLRNWQALNTQLDRAGREIENSFIKGLAPLTPAFTQLSASVAKAIDAFLANPNLKKWVDDFGGAIERAGKYLGSDQFRGDVSNFIDGVAKLARAVVKALNWLGIIDSSNYAGSEEKELEKRRKMGPTITAPSGYNFPNTAGGGRGGAGGVDAASFLAGLEKSKGLPSGMLDSVWAQESGRGKNMRSSAGAKGHFQFMDATAKQYGLGNPDDFTQSSQAASSYLKDLMGQYKGDADKALAAYNYGPGNVNKQIAKHGGDWKQHLPAETSKYISDVRSRMGAGNGSQVSIHITNATGGSAIVQASQLAH